MANVKEIAVTTKIHPRSARRLETWAKRHRMSLDQAMERLVQVGIGRLEALSKYNRRVKRGEMGA